MKIDRLTARIVRVPQARPAISANMRIDAIWFVLLDIDTDSGPRGSALVWGFNKSGAAALKAVTEQLSSVLLGEDPLYIEKIYKRMWYALVQWGHAGIPLMGLSLVDIALWDLLGKSCGRPIADLLGRNLAEVPAYASGLWISDDLEALQKEAQGNVAAGYRAMKMRVGRSALQKDVAAVRAVREAIGPDIALMVDFSSIPTRDQALRMGRALEEFELTWIEDPVVDEDERDHAFVARELRTPVCFGEKVYGPEGIRRIIDAQAADVLMADLQRAGGITGWQRIAALAAAAHLPLSSHILPEVNVHCIASAPTGYYLEFMDWGESLFTEPMRIVQGKARVPARPGLGLDWNEPNIAAALQDRTEYRK